MLILENVQLKGRSATCIEGANLVENLAVHTACVGSRGAGGRARRASRLVNYGSALSVRRRKSRLEISKAADMLNISFRRS